MTKLSVAIAGLGAIGSGMVREIVRSEPNIRISAVSSRDAAKAQNFLAQLGLSVPVLPLQELPSTADLIVECLPAAQFDVIADATMTAGKALMVLSVGQLARRDDIIPFFRKTNRRLLVPTGAILGLDVVRALARSDVLSVRITTRKSPKSLVGAPYLDANGIDPTTLTAPTRVFSGPTREAIKGFPVNVNVAVALSLAGIGIDDTQCDIWVDPHETANVHTIEVETAGTSVNMTIRGIPDPNNPRTSQMTALSAVESLRRMIDPVWIGS
jgi:aspartate dehydrogenase